MPQRIDIHVLARVLALLGGLALLVWAMRLHVLLSSAVLLTLVAMAFVARGRRRNEHAQSNRRDVAVSASLTLLVWAGIAATLRIIDSADSEVGPQGFTDGLSVAGLVVVATCTVAGASGVRYAINSLLHRRRVRRSRGAKAPGTT